MTTAATSISSTTVGSAPGDTVESPTSSTQAFGSNGTAASSTGALSFTDNTPTGFSYTASAPGPIAATSVLRTNGGGTPVSGVTSYIEYSFIFEVSATEVVNIVFNFTHSLTEDGINGAIEWNVTGPSGLVGALSGSVGNSGTTTESLSSVPIPQQSAQLNEAGSYTFTWTATANPGAAGSVGPGQSAEIELESLSFSAVSVGTVPEAGITMLGALGALVLLRHRSRG